METTARADGQREAKLDLLHASISDLQHALRGGSLSAVALLEACNKRIEEVNDTLHAVISIDKTARQQAERCDEALKKKGQILGPLHGIPVLIKDHIDVYGLPTTHGSHALATCMPRDDAELVKRLKRAGAIILGKSNESEWGFGRGGENEQLSGWSGVGGQCTTPLYPNGDPIGSSGGSAVAVAVGLVPMAVGSELWGSIIAPSQANALSSLKPSYGWIPRTGSIAADFSQVTYGPLCKYIEDSAICLEVMAGKFDEDPATADQPDAVPQFRKLLDTNALKGARLGIVRNYPAKLGGMEDAPEQVRQAVIGMFDAAVEDLRNLGAVTVDAEIDYGSIWDIMDDTYKPVCNVETRLDFERYCKTVDGTDIKTMQDVVDFNKSHPDLEMPRGREGQSGLEAAAKSGNRDEEFYKKRAQFQKICRDVLSKPMDAHNLDALVTIGSLWERMSAWASFPEGVTPMGFLPDDTVPVKRHAFEQVDFATYDYHPNKSIGICFIGRRWEDARILSYTHAFEKHKNIRSSIKFYDAAVPRTQPKLV